MFATQDIYFSDSFTSLTIHVCFEPLFVVYCFIPMVPHLINTRRIRLNIFDALWSLHSLNLFPSATSSLIN